MNLANSRIYKRLKDKITYLDFGFWFFQIIGCLFYMILDQYSSWNDLSDKYILFEWIIGLIIIFLLILIARIICRYILKKEIHFIFIVLTLIVILNILKPVWILVFKGIINLTALGKSSYEYTNIKELFSDDLNIRMHIEFIFLMWSIFYFGIKFWQNLLKEKKRAEDAELLAQKAQMEMLRYQINPHFLFNSLNSIQALIYENQRHADLMLTELSDFLRYTLQFNTAAFIPLEEEISIIKRYLNIEKTRFEERLAYKLEISDSTKEILVPSFITQPFVENSIKHGMKSSPEQLFISIRSYILDNNLCIDISNSGQMEPSSTEGGQGIKNVRDRLDNAYKDSYKLAIFEKAGHVMVKLKINLKACINTAP